MVQSEIFKCSSITSSHNNPLQLSLQNPSSSLYSGTLCPKTLAFDQNLTVYLTVSVRIDTCGGVGATTLESWRSSRRTYIVGGRNSNCHRMEGPSMTFVFYHGGKFKKDEGENLYYEPDHTEVLMGVEGDTLDVFFVKGYYKKLGYTEARECWWKSPGVPLEYRLRRLATNHDLIAMVKDYRRNFNLINLYFEHGVLEPFVVDEQEEDPKKPYSQPTKSTAAPPQIKGKTKVTTTTRAGRHVKTLEVEEDSDSHDSYESAEDSLYKPPKVLGDDEYSSDSDDGMNSTRVNKKSEVKEKHKPGKTILIEKEIETDDSSYEASEDEDDCDSVI
ncbi:hypothetical protein Ahy_A04g019203 [Arachis hypogaea]|uniref:PB1-like domain-containing protein n=1 Tax=Arachis hypogaea TaxID=3818 RepID=A0A445DFI6_ARAHY|nr:hypothetical protein Ahy_A04g019203 [Arachis hypogaea]